MTNAYSTAADNTKLVCLHGFIDNASLWSTLGEALEKKGFQWAANDLAGAGTRQDQGGPYSLARAADEVVEFVKSSDAPVVLIGHSMGAQIAELASARLGSKVRALVLITPTPLQGNVLPDEVRSMLRNSGGDSVAQAGIRRAFSHNLTEEQIVLATNKKSIMGREAVQDYYDAFTGGDPAGEQATACACPVLIIGAKNDPVIAEDLVRIIQQARFPGSKLELVGNSGHWPHIEQAEETAGIIAEFLASVG